MVVRPCIDLRAQEGEHARRSGRSETGRVEGRGVLTMLVEMVRMSRLAEIFHASSRQQGGKFSVHVVVQPALGSPTPQFDTLHKSLRAHATIIKPLCFPPMIFQYAFCLSGITGHFSACSVSSRLVTDHAIVGARRVVEPQEVSYTVARYVRDQSTNRFQCRKADIFLMYLVSELF